MQDKIETFADQNYLIFTNECNQFFKVFSDSIASTLAEETGVKTSQLHELHNFVRKEDINPIRIKAFQALNTIEDWEIKYFSLAKKVLQQLIGPDVSIQIKLNLSIQMPGDETSILMLHSDTLSGQSSFEVVLWTAITDAQETNAMYMFDREQSHKLYDVLPSYQYKGMSKLLEDNLEKAFTVKADCGDCVLFSSTLFHGNRLNTTDKTRISLNCRFKSLFSPEYSNTPHERVTGTFYKPLLKSPLTKIGLSYNDEIKF